MRSLSRKITSRCSSQSPQPDMSRQRTSSGNGQFPNLDSPSPTHKRRANHSESRIAPASSLRHRPNSVSSASPSQKSPAGGRSHHRGFTSCSPRGQQQERLERSLSNVGDASVTSKSTQHQTRCSPERHHHASKILTSHHHSGCFSPISKHTGGKGPSPSLTANRNRPASRRGIVRVASADLSDPDPHGTVPGRKGLQMSSKVNPGNGRKSAATCCSSPARSISEPHDVSAGLESRDSTPPSSPPLEDQPVEGKTLRKVSPRYNIRLMLTNSVFNYPKPADDNAGTEVCDKDSSPPATVTSTAADKDDANEKLETTTTDHNVDAGPTTEERTTEEGTEKSELNTDLPQSETTQASKTQVDDVEDENEAVACSPDSRFLKFDQEIGRGSFKTVFKGLDSLTGVSVAWCELKERLNKSERNRFREEAEMLKNLQHPNIVRFFDYYEIDMSPKRKYLVLITELMTSGTLKTYLKRFKKLNIKVMKSWCRQILKGLNFLHSRQPPIIHRDLKLDNIFITGESGSVKIGDLGLATLKNRSFAKSVIGTPEFMAPEVYDENYTESVDIYSFGMCMLEMATNQYPYAECSGPASIYKKVINRILPENFKKVENPELREIISLCISTTKEDRPTVKDLMQCNFFVEDTGLKVEFVNKESLLNNPEINKVELWLRFLDSKKRKEKTTKENEAIEFEYNILSDNADEVAKAMADNDIILHDDCRTVAMLIRNEISCLTRERARKKKLAETPQHQNVTNNCQPGSQIEKNIQPVVVSQPFHNVSKVGEQIIQDNILYKKQPQVFQTQLHTHQASMHPQSPKCQTTSEYHVDLPNQSTEVSTPCFYYNFTHTPQLGTHHIIQPVVVPHSETTERETIEANSENNKVLEPNKPEVFGAVPGAPPTCMSYDIPKDEIKEDTHILSRQASMGSDDKKASPVMHNIPNVTTVGLTDGPPDTVPPEQLALSSQSILPPTQTAIESEGGKKYVFIPGISYSGGVENQAIPCVTTVTVPQGQHAEQIQYQDPNIANAGISVKPPPVEKDAEELMSVSDEAKPPLVTSETKEHLSEIDRTDKKKKRRRTQDRSLKLTVIGVEEHNLVECSLESTKGKTVTFKFDFTDTAPDEIANKLVITNLLSENHADIFTDSIEEVIRQLKLNPHKIPVIQLESTKESGNRPCSPPTLRRATLKDQLDLFDREKELSFDSQDSSLPSTPQDSEKDFSPKGVSSPSRHIKQTQVSNDASAPESSTLVSKTTNTAVASVNTHTSIEKDKNNQAIQSSDVKVSEADSSYSGLCVVTAPVSELPVEQTPVPSGVISESKMLERDVAPAGLPISEESIVPPSHVVLEESKRTEKNLSSSSSSGSNTLHTQSSHLRPVVPDLCVLGLKLAELSGSALNGPPGNVSLPPKSSQPLQSMNIYTQTPSSIPSKNGDIVDSLQAPTSAVGVTPSSVPVPTCIDTSVTALQNLKKLDLTPSTIPNIIEGLQAIFSVSCTAETVTTPAHPKLHASTHSHMSVGLLSSSDSVNASNVIPTPEVKPAFTTSPAGQDNPLGVCVAPPLVQESLPTPSKNFSRFKVTPVIEKGPVLIPSLIPVTLEASQSIISPSEPSQTQNSKIQGRFQITRVADEVPLNIEESKSDQKDTHIGPHISESSNSISNVNSAQQNLQDTVCAEISQNVLLQHSCSNPALVLSCSVPDVNNSVGLTKSLSEIGTPPVNVPYSSDTVSPRDPIFMPQLSSETSHNPKSAAPAFLPPGERLSDVCCERSEAKPVLKDANANLHFGYNIASTHDNGKNIETSLSENNKDYELWDCYDAYLKVILKRQEQERQELNRRHEQELESYKMHHLRAHFDGKCCFHGKNIHSAAASSSNVSYANAYLHSKEQNITENSVGPSVYQSMHFTQGGSTVSDLQSKTYVQDFNHSRPSEYLPVTNYSVNMPNYPGSFIQVGESNVRENVSDFQYVRNQLLQHVYKQELEIPYLPPGQSISTPCNVGTPGSSFATFTVPPMQIHNVYSNENVAALSNTAVQTSVEGTPHSSPQTVRRIIKATSALNVNPAFHQVTPHIVSAVALPQQISDNSALHGHSQMSNVSLPYSQSSDVSVSSPSKFFFSQSGS